MHAAFTGRVARIRWLLARGARLETRDVHGRTALVWAAEGGSLEAVRALVAAGADVRAVALRGLGSALAFAARGGHGAVAAELTARGADAAWARGGFVMTLDEEGKESFGPRIEGPLAAWRAAHPGALVADVRAVALRGLGNALAFAARGGHGETTAELTTRGADTAWAHGGFVMPLKEDGNSDFGPHIVGPLAAWRAAHPGALVANVAWRRDLVDADFMHLAGVEALNMAHCDQPGITDAAFTHLRGIHTLDMRGCSQPGITDAAFAHLRDIECLDVAGCAPAVVVAAAAARRT